MESSGFAFTTASLVLKMVKNLPAMQETGSIPGWGRSPGKGHGNRLQYSCLDFSCEKSLFLTIAFLQQNTPAIPDHQVYICSCCLIRKKARNRKNTRKGKIIPQQNSERKTFIDMTFRQAGFRQSG